MTTNVRVSAHCAPDKEVVVTRVRDSDFKAETVILDDGQSREFVAYDDLSIGVRETLKHG